MGRQSKKCKPDRPPTTGDIESMNLIQNPADRVLPDQREQPVANDFGLLCGHRWIHHMTVCDWCWFLNAVLTFECSERCSEGGRARGLCMDSLDCIHNKFPTQIPDRPCSREMLSPNELRIFRVVGGSSSNVKARYLFKLRRTAYRAFMVWAHGFLDRRNPKPIPACVVSTVRASLPYPEELNVGFMKMYDYPAAIMALG
ncbi:Hypothetical predicted protein [Pelobates cultripes]|uniref:Uncharacterized protein n=1 Tax=Pelobates cultripes TaxID=61616 RepID=A0AAD1T9C0_PELCU|nr:Hypothetical predicted protein [Pelobates cultripes]